MPKTLLDEFSISYPVKTLLPDTRIYTLRHLESQEFVCLIETRTPWLACFTDMDTCLHYRAEIGLRDHCAVVSTTLERIPFTRVWLDGELFYLPDEGVDSCSYN